MLTRSRSYGNEEASLLPYLHFKGKSHQPGRQGTLRTSHGIREYIGIRPGLSAAGSGPENSGGEVMITIELKVSGESEHQVIHEYADILADIEWRGFNKSRHYPVINKVGSTLILTQELTKGNGYATDGGQCLRNDKESTKV